MKMHEKKFDFNEKERVKEGKRDLHKLEDKNP